MKNYKLLLVLLSVQIVLTVLSSCSDDKPITTIQSGFIAYTNIDIIDGVSPSILLKQTIIIDKENGLILDIFDTDSKRTDSIIEIKDMSGKVMMPGFIEGHFHLASTVW